MEFSSSKRHPHKKPKNNDAKQEDVTKVDTSKTNERKHKKGGAKKDVKQDETKSQDDSNSDKTLAKRSKPPKIQYAHGQKNPCKEFHRTEVTKFNIVTFLKNEFRFNSKLISQNKHNFKLDQKALCFMY